MVDSTADIVTENLNEGTDTVETSITYSLATLPNVENLTLTGAALINATGNALGNVITGNAAENILDGGAGADTMAGGLGDDTYVVQDIGDVVVEAANEGADNVQSSVDYTLSANIESLTLVGTAAINGTGNGQNNTLTGNAADNVLDGGGSITFTHDILNGGTGNDTYLYGRGSGFVDILEAQTDVAGNVDTVRFAAGIKPGDIILSQDSQTNLLLKIASTSSDYLLVKNFFATQDSQWKVEQFVFEDGTIWTPSSIMATFTSGTSADDLLSGFIWGDTLDGAGGNDVIYGNAGNDNLEGGSGNDTLYGDDYSSSLTGNDTLHGGAGSDSLIGGKGNDTYLFQRGDGIDTISDALGNDKIVLGAGILPTDVSLFYDGGSRILAIDASSQTQLLIQEYGVVNNQIEQIVFADGTIWDAAMMQSLTVTGTANAMVGTAGNDTYIVDNAYDTITEGLNQGIDTARTSVSFNLPANVENMTATGYLNITLVGNTLNNTITGNSGNNKIFGGGGIDTLTGGQGDDTYTMDYGGSVIELANEGIDTVSVSGSFSTITLQNNVENMNFLSNYYSTVSAYGNALDNVINEQTINGSVVAYVDNYGNFIGNSIDGGAGADTMSLSHGGTYYVDNIGDRIYASGMINVFSSVDFVLPEFAPPYNPPLTGSSAFLTLTGSNAIRGVGNAAANTLDGRQNVAANILEGGAGNDTYLVGTNDTIIELANGGNDTLLAYADPYSRMSFRLSPNVENLLLSTANSYAADLEGADDANHLVGNAGINTIRGMGGNDLIEGGGNAGDVLDGGNGNDTITGAGSLLGGAGDDSLNGGTGNDDLNGGDGNDTLKGGVGNDMLTGGAGNDVYLFSRGDGQDMVSDHDSALGNVDTVRFGAGIAANDITFKRQGNDLILGIVGTSEQLTISGWGAGADYQIERVEFADGSVWDAAALSDMTVNHAPVVTAAIANQALLQGQALSLNVGSLFSDADSVRGDSLIFSAVQTNGYALPAWLTFDAATRTFTGAPGNADVGGLNLCVTATDTGGLSASSSFVINVANVNDAPILVRPLIAHTVTQDVWFSYALPDGAFTDADAIYGDVLSYSATLADGSALPAWLTFDAATQSFSGTPGSVNIGSLNVKVIAADIGGLASSGVFTLTVEAPIPTIMGTSGNDTLTGGALVEKLLGLGGNDILNGGAGADIMLGGTGDDTYVVDNIGDVVTESMDEGIDTVQSPITYTLGGNVENLILTGTSAVNGSGNILDNSIIGNSAANILVGGDGNDMLNGGAGADKLLGGLGNDSYVVDNAGDVVTENPNEGTDTVQSSITCTLGANVENLTLTGSSAINGTGNASANVIDGSLNTAANVLAGGAGNDIYIIGAGDSITEAANAGTDTVMASATCTLGSNLENLILIGTAAINGSGNSLNNVLTGNSGGNVLSGGTGLDTMSGGMGNDIYVVDNAGDIAIENLNEGLDTVQSSITHILGANVENLTLTGTAAINGTGNALDNVLTGNSAVNTLTGGEGNDTLDGGAGADKLLGGLGNDIYVVDNTGDAITENTNEGVDSVQSKVTCTLAANVENLILTGTTAINGTGNALNNLLVGNAANNTLAAGTGNDIIQGGAGTDALTDATGANLLDGGTGNDTLTGGAGNEFFAGGAGNDTITTGNGADIIAFDRGNGQDILNGGTGADNIISLGGGISYSDLALSKVGNDLILEVGNNEQLTLKNWYATTANYKNVIDLQIVADAMASFDAASTDPLLNKAIQEFDFTALSNSFDQARGANSTFMHWSMASSLLAAHLSSSDTEAWGGDLAHQYGMNGSFVGMSLVAAQNVINDAQFGARNQALHPLPGLQGGLVALAA